MYIGWTTNIIFGGNRTGLENIGDGILTQIPLNIPKKWLILQADSILKHWTFKKATQIQENKSNFHFSKYIFEKFLVSTHHFFQAALGGGLSFHLDLRFFFYVMIMMIDEKKLCDVVFFFNLCQVCNDGRYNFGNGIVGSQILFHSQPITILT